MFNNAMTDPAQAVLLIVIVILTILLLVLGVQVFFILKELRKTINKANKVLDDTEIITDSIAGPVANFSNMITGIKAGSAIASLLSKMKGKKDE